MTASTTRGELLDQLRVAAELEHGLCLQYLFTAASLKDRIDEGGLTTDTLQLVRRWKSTLYFIAGQEMLHLAQVINLTTAAGGQPHLIRPNFPQRPGYYPTGLPWGLWPFRYEVIELYAWYERPDDWPGPPWWWSSGDPLEHNRFQPLLADSPAEKDPFAHLPGRFARPKAGGQRTIADLYAQIAGSFHQVPDVIIGDADKQLDGAEFDAPTLVAVTDVDAADRAVEMIVEQGEGRPDDVPDSHLGAYLSIMQDLYDHRHDRDFRPARDVAANPLSRLHADNTYPGWRLIEDQDTRAVNDLTSAVYRAILDLISLGVGRSRLVGLSVRLMTGVLAPLLELLTRLPMGQDDSPGADSRATMAGAGFELDPRMPPPDGRSGLLAVRDALSAAADTARRLAGRHPELAAAPTVLTDLAAALTDLT